jgi:hypothetical protein
MKMKKPKAKGRKPSHAAEEARQPNDSEPLASESLSAPRPFFFREIWKPPLMSYNLKGGKIGWALASWFFL